MSKWITAFAAAPREGKVGAADLAGRTVRCRIKVNLSGDELRLRFGNLFGEEPMRIGAVRVWNGKRSAEITFGGQHGLRLGRGGILRSDPAYLPVKAGDTLQLLMYFPEGCPMPHSVSGTWPTEHSEPGNFTDTPDFPAAEDDLRKDAPFPGPDPLPGLMNLDILSEDDACAVAAFGDSITEMRLWFDPLEKSFAEKYPGKKSLINLGISGGRLLLPTGGKFKGFAGELFGLSGLERMDWDILGASGIDTVLLALGVNDVSQPGSGEFCPPLEERCDLAGFASGASKLTRRLHEAGIKVVVCTITPFGGMPGCCEETMQLRDQINSWLRRAAAAGEFDGIVDFGPAVEDPDKPGFMLPAYDSGDHLHPSPLGGEKMAAVYGG
jgi:hypothetical protein